MRVLIPVDPSRAHLFPIVPIASALRNAGHQVRLASWEGFCDTISAAGLTPVALAEGTTLSPHLAPGAPEPRHPDESERYADILGITDFELRDQWHVFYQQLLVPVGNSLRADRPETDDLIEFARSWRPDLVIWDFTQPAGAVAARVCGAASARMPPGRDNFGWGLEQLAEHREELIAAGLDDNPLATLVRPVAERYGVEVDDELLVGQWTIDIYPEGMGLPTSLKKVPMRWVPFNGSDAFPKWLHEPATRPRIAYCLGESTRRFIKGDWDRTPILLEALSGLDVEVVATLNDVQLDGVPVPANVRAVDWLPLSNVMSSCSALIHHGGGGTYAAAAAVGIPQLVCDTEESILLRIAEEEDAPETGTFRTEKEHGVQDVSDARKPTPWIMPAKKMEATPCSNYVIDRGAGIRLNHRAFTVEDLRKQISAVLTEESYQDGARVVHEEWKAMPLPAEVVPVLEKLTAEHRKTVR
ncbi:nucleotide disphospho-sugar-binding domain-containing protein [Amycolatopsis sp. NPDC051071]|uniref:nucleotide disphospho-sugar-binding domain-containing protein n=1 Tax=Amycolatopsis sp. NPDC051071 TaxID=3154637 RepID=UPI003431FEDD